MREDITVERGDGVIIKRAHTIAGEAELTREARFIEVLAEMPYAPKS